MRSLLLFFVILYIVTVSMAAPPDLTAGGVPNDDPHITINLGPTGARGWVYHDNIDTGESRQILVTKVDSGSPADGILEVDDVILGADGSGAEPSNFSSDARKTLGLAIGDAEARNPATLKLIRWRSGSTATVTLTLRYMGAYSATAPYDCPKSTKILEEGLQYVYDKETSGRYRFGAITLLAKNDPEYRAKVQTEARALIPSQATMDQMMSDERDDNPNLITWQRGHTLIFLTEYYLATVDAGIPDTTVVPAIEAYAVNIAKNTSMFGTTGHAFADKNTDGSPNGPVGSGYGTVNTPSLFCLIGLELALECGLTNAEIPLAIERAIRFFAYHSGKGAIPYGDHEPFYKQHENNGKCGTAALAFMFQEDRVAEAKFFAKMCTASATERERGHTGSFFNYMWAPLGAAVGGPDTAAALFGRLSWAYDLNRCWDGRFQYDCLNGEGHHSGSTWYDFRMSTPMLLTYALPLRQLRITGKGHDSSRWLTRTDAAEAIAADDYDADSRSDSELITDLSNWSPRVRYAAGDELGTRSIDSSELSQITDLATNTGGISHSRAGACYALGQIGNSSSSATMAALLTDDDNYVRFMAAEAMRHLPQASNLTYLDTVMAAAASTAEPLFPMVEEDPLHMAHSKLAILLFNHILPDSLDGVDRDLLYPAIEAVAETPVGMGRSTLEKTYQKLDYIDVLALSSTIVDSIITHAPADRMFSHGVRYGGAYTLYKHDIAEGVPATMAYAADTFGGIRTQPFGLLGDFGGSLYTVTPDPNAVDFIKLSLGDWEIGDFIQDVLNRIAADTNPVPLMPLKSITSATVDDTVLTLPASSTVLRVSGFDHMQGDSIYTWRKTLGPGQVTISPNGTSATASTIQFDAAPGAYQFEVTMSDSRGFTEVYETVTVFLRTDGEIDDDPPLSNPASFDAAPFADSGTSISMTAAIGADVSGPVEYLFSETTGNPGATSSSWQTSPSYTDNGLSPLMQYAYMVTMRDSLGNTGATSSAVSVTTPGTPPPSDIIGVNFYAYGAMDSADYDAVTLQADESAGFGGWNTTGWENYSVPWGLSSPASPVTVSSPLSASATLTLNEVRNGGPYVWDAPHLTLPGYGNGDLMDGHCNGTEDPGDGSCIFDMTVSNISFDTYDVIVYIGANSAQYGDGNGKYVFNGGSEQDFTLTSGGFSYFAEITDSATPGNYILFENVTGSSFTLQMWGNGFNHIGPTGFQIARAGSTSDNDPPTPNGATFATPPYRVSDSAISMTATTGSDASGPVEYLFSCLTAGGHGSGWQTSPSYTDTGLVAGVDYYYTVTMRDSLGNTGTASAGVVVSVAVPDVAGLAQASAEAAIVAASMTVGNVTTAYSSTVAAGSVISQTPAGNTNAPKGTSIDLVVSMGPLVMTPVPVVVGMPQAAAEADIVAGGFTVGMIDTAYSGTVVSGNVISQNPAGSTNAPEGSSVDLVVSLGPAIVTVWNVNFGDGIDESDDYVGAAAENTANSTWNSVTTDECTDMTLEDSTGSAIAGVTLDINGTISIEYPLTGVGDEIFDHWIYGKGSGTTPFSMVIGNLSPGVTYDLVVYSDWFLKGGTEAFEVTQTAGTGLTGTFYVNHGDGPPFTYDEGSVGPLLEDTNPANVDEGPTNYARITGLTPDANGDLAFSMLAGKLQGYCPFSGFQLVSFRPDTEPPSPDPMTFASLPVASGTTSISMTAATASDPSGVEYYFTCTAGGGNDSGWQDSPAYTDSGLSPDVTYSYTVKARDKRDNQLETGESDIASAVIDLYDGKMGLSDFAGFAKQWMQSNCGFCEGADLTGDGDVDIDDLHVFAQKWLAD